jgi:methyl-accepting chemotaxis protein
MQAGGAAVCKGRESAQQASEALARIIARVDGVAGTIETVATASREQSVAGQEMARELRGMGEETVQARQESASLAEAAERLQRCTQALRTAVAQFRLSA